MNANQTKVVGVGASLLLFVVYTYSLFGASDRFSMTPFRESHTAIAAYYIAAGESPFLAYEVPVLGKPWAVPMEFPFFQWLTGRIGGTDIDELRWTGRTVSLLFWLGCIWIASRIMRLAPVEPHDRIWFLLLLAAAPIFPSYGAAFLVESFVLFVALAYLWTFLLFRSRPRILFLLAACVFGIIASLAKPTTWAPFSGVIILILLLDIASRLRETDKGKRISITCVSGSLIIGLPLAAGLMWVGFGDELKMLNPLTRGLVSENLARWNYGSLEQKLSPVVWAVILFKQTLLLFGPALVLVPFVVAAGLWQSGFRRRSWTKFFWILLALAGYFSAPVVFTNLHYRHDYYLYANGIFLVAAFVLSLSVIRRELQARWIQWIYPAVFIFTAISAIGYLGLRKSLTEPQEAVLIEALQGLEAPGPLLLFGFDWSSKIPYEVERRALMLNLADPADPKLVEVLENNHGLAFAAMAVAAPRFLPVAEHAVAELGLVLDSRTELWPGVFLFTENPPHGYSEDSQPDLLKLVDTRLAAHEGEGGLIYLHTPVSPEATADGLFEVMLRRNDDLFFIDSSTLKFYRFRNYFPAH